MNKRPARGAALLAAMLTVTLVASFAAAALWQQWRSTEVEAAERVRMQSAWVLVGALDWSRLILGEDGKSPDRADHLAEPWAVPLEEARLSSFLAADKNIASDALEGLPEAFLSGRIVDAQSKLNVTNLVGANTVDTPAAKAFTKLFQILGLPAAELALLRTGVRLASAGAASPQTGGGPIAQTDSAAAPLMPQQLRQLAWFGLSNDTIAALEPYVTVLPEGATALNLNTASAEAIAASTPQLDLAGAKRLVAQRALNYFKTTSDAQKAIAESGTLFVEGQHSVSSRYFEVLGRLRIDKTWVEEHSLLRRDGAKVTIVWRERGAGATLAAGKP